MLGSWAYKEKFKDILIENMEADFNLFNIISVNSNSLSNKDIEQLLKSPNSIDHNSIFLKEFKEQRIDGILLVSLNYYGPIPRNFFITPCSFRCDVDCYLYSVSDLSILWKWRYKLDKLKVKDNLFNKNMNQYLGISLYEIKDCTVLKNALIRAAEIISTNIVSDLGVK